MRLATSWLLSDRRHMATDAKELTRRVTEAIEGAVPEAQHFYMCWLDNQGDAHTVTNIPAERLPEVLEFLRARAARSSH
jgi:hypothetical protein